MTDFAPLEACSERFGGSIRDVKPHKGTLPHHKNVWSWRVTGQRAKDLAAQIKPYVLVKNSPLDDILAWEAGDNRRYIVIDGATRCLKDWAEHFGMNYNTVQLRIAAGWDAKTALITPRIRGKRSKIERENSLAPSNKRKPYQFPGKAPL